MNRQKRVNKLIMLVRKFRLPLFVEHLKTILLKIDKNLYEAFSEEYYKQVELVENALLAKLENNYIQELSDNQIDAWIKNSSSARFKITFRITPEDFKIIFGFVHAELVKKGITNLPKKV